MNEPNGHEAEGLPLGEVERLVELLKESGVGEIRVKKGDLEVAVKAMPEVPATAPSQTIPETIRHPEAEPSPETNGFHTIKSPLVGTFYRAPAPGEDFFVEVGDSVRAGQTLCIVEAMKLMNEISADVSGEIVEILAENSAGVEYDEPLFHIKPE
ncbi:MAG: acetyl-CoA carboxylase biotin carboxyl carrier protein [Rubrobacter sp.]|nr:acetyl-CoA carboxylase biotin carboxyl carrier protein [Rubrobacter sp.]